MRRSERPIRLLPKPLLIAFVLALAVQIIYHHASRQQLDAAYRPLTEPLSADLYRRLAMGSEELLGYWLALKLQLHDNQAGRHFRYSLIDYAVLVRRLDAISDISRRSEYPMLLASRIYTLTRSPSRLRQVLAFIERRFDDDPQRHWRRLAEASVIAKHKLGDLELALRLAKKLARQPAQVDMPRWARDIEFLLLAEMNELESSIAIIQALLQSQSISDPDEHKFLTEKLLEFQQQLFESQQNRSIQP